MKLYTAWALTCIAIVIGAVVTAISFSRWWIVPLCFLFLPEIHTR